MISFDKKDNCCGCYACVNVCPKNCIVMKEDDEGFYYPNVNNSRCVDCKLCEKVCPIINKEKFLQDNGLEVNNTFVAYTKNETIRRNSSSGGIFSELAVNVLNNDGAVFGVAFDSNFNAHHIMVNNVYDLNKLRGSKYIQSQVENTYQEAEELLKSGKLVLFTGVACQIAGLKTYLRKSYENLITVDVLCHGVPSGKVWRKYIEYKQKKHNSKIKEFYFRNKDKGWKLFTVKQKYANNQCESSIFTQDPFIQLFLGEICLRPSCYNCRFKDIKRPSDITIGDSWGIENYMPEMDDDKGTSVVIAHTEKGINLINCIKDNLIIKNAELDEALPPTADSRKSVLPHKNRERLFHRLDKNTNIEKLADLVRDRFPKPSIKSRIKKKIKKVCNIKQVI